MPLGPSRSTHPEALAARTTRITAIISPCPPALSYVPSPLTPFSFLNPSPRQCANRSLRRLTSTSTPVMLATRRFGSSSSCSPLVSSECSSSPNESRSELDSSTGALRCHALPALSIGKYTRLTPQVVRSGPHHRYALVLCHGCRSRCNLCPYRVPPPQGERVPLPPRGLLCQVSRRLE